MSGPAQLETPRPTITEQKSKSEIVAPIHTEAIHAATAEAVSDQLGRTPYPQSAEKVSAEGESNTILAKIENDGIGTTAMEAGHVIARGFENTLGDISGSTYTYGAKGDIGHKAVLGRMSRIAKFKGAVQRLTTSLFKK